MDCSLPGSSIRGIFQARVLGWVAISFSRRSSRPRDWTLVSLIVGRRFTIWATRGGLNYKQTWNEVKVTQSCATLCDPMDYTVHGILQARILVWVAFPFSRGSFQPRSLNPGLPHCRRILYQLSHGGSPRILEWVANPFSSGSSRPRNQTRVSCIAGRFFTNWAMREDIKEEL